MANTLKTIKILAVIVMLGGAAGVFGWVFGVTLLKSVSPYFVTMKLSTALSFILSGLILYLLPGLIGNKSPWPWVIMPGAVLVILLLMTTLLASSLFDISTGVERLIIPEEKSAIRSVSPGIPSMMTMADFMLIAFAGLAALFLTAWLPWLLKATGVILAATGLVAEVGYVTNIQYLYFQFEGVSTAMAIHTAFLFIILGAGFLLSERLALSV